MKSLKGGIAVFMSIIAMNVYSQGVGINGTGASPDPSAGLDISFIDKGMLAPRMTAAQRNAISNPALGLIIFNTTTNCVNIWLGSTWKQLCGDCDFNNPVAGNSGPICAEQTLNLSATSIPGATYQWTGPNGFVSNLQNPSIPSATAAASGSYSVSATLNGCTTQPQSTVATVNAIPQTPVASNNGPLCVGQTLNISSTTVSGASYSWSGPNGFSDNAQNPVIGNLQTENSGTYSVVASVSGCSSAPGSTNVVVNATPPTPGTITGGLSMCPNSSGNVYSIAAVSGATSYNWTVPSGASISANSGTSITVTFGPNPAGSISVSATNTCGTSAQSSINITQTSVCSPKIFNVTDTGASGSLQTFTVPVDATYTIEVWGAQGGNTSYTGGSGARMRGDFALTTGQQLKILVGQKGANPPGNATGGGGGGGGSFVALSNNTPLIIAGGGGGAGKSYAGSPGLTTTTAGTSTGGNNSTGGSISSAGIASSGNYSGGSGGGGTCCDGSYGNTNGGLGAGGGAGFTGNGGVGQNQPTIAYSFLSGGSGSYHTANYGDATNSFGGYGGGGNGIAYDYQAGGGGGGGYTGGGGGCGLNVGGGGGGGGSYNNGSNQNNSSGVQTGHGQVIITWN